MESMEPIIWRRPTCNEVYLFSTLLSLFLIEWLLLSNMITVPILVERSDHRLYILLVANSIPERHAKNENKNSARSICTMILEKSDLHILFTGVRSASVALHSIFTALHALSE